MRTTWYVFPPLTTGNDPKSSSPEFSARSPGVEDVNDVEHEKQQVSDGCSEAKSRKSESPKKHRGGSRCSKRKPNGRTFREKISSYFRRNSKGRDSVCSISSSVSAPGGPVTEKPLLSKRSASERKARSNPPSGVTFPTHEGAPCGLKPLTSDERKELYKVLSDEMKGKLNSSSFPPEYKELLYLLYVDKRELRLLLSDPKAKQVCSVLLPEKIEQVQSSSPKEVLRLLHTFFSNQKISDNFLISSKVDSLKTEKHLQKEREVFV